MAATSRGEAAKKPALSFKPRAYWQIVAVVNDHMCYSTYAELKYVEISVIICTNIDRSLN